MADDPRESCFVLTEQGRVLIETDIKNAVTKVIVYGAPTDRPDLIKNVEDLIINKGTTFTQLDEYTIITSRPIAGFFEKTDGKLTYIVELSQSLISWKGDLGNKKVVIRGLSLTSENNQIVALVPIKGVTISGEQAQVRLAIKIHSKTGKPGQEVYYTGSYLTREEYEAAKVTIATEVTEITNRRINPMLQEKLDDFTHKSGELLVNLNANFDTFKEEAREELKNIKDQATKDLTGVQDYMEKLLKMLALEEHYRTYGDRMMRLLSNMYFRIKALEDFLIEAQKEVDTIGELGMFFGRIPSNYILFNHWYLVDEYCYFVDNKTSLFPEVAFITRRDRSRSFKIKWEPKYSADNQLGIGGLYIKAHFGGDRKQINTFNKQDQSLPVPYTNFNIQGIKNMDWAEFKVEVLHYGIDQIGGTKWLTTKKVEDRWRLPVSETSGKSTRTWKVQMDPPYHSHTFDYTLNPKTYTESTDTPVETENMELLLGIKAKLPYNVSDIVNNILDDKFLSY